MKLKIDSVIPNGDSYGNSNLASYTKPRVNCSNKIKVALIEHIMSYCNFKPGMEITIRFEEDE